MTLHMYLCSLTDFDGLRTRKEYRGVNLDKIQYYIDIGRLDPSHPITMKSLFDAGMSPRRNGFKILATVFSLV